MVAANSAGSEASESDFERRFAAGRDFSVPMGGWVARWIAIRRSWWETLCVGWVAGGRGMRSFDSVWRAHSYISIWFIHSIRTFDSFEDANSRVDARRLISARCNSPQFASTFDRDDRLAGNGQWARMMGAGDGRRWWARRSVKLRFAPRTQFEHTELLWLFFFAFFGHHNFWVTTICFQLITSNLVLSIFRLLADLAGLSPTSWSQDFHTVCDFRLFKTRNYSIR